MTVNTQSYTTLRAVKVTRSIEEVVPRVINEELPALLNAHRGGLLMGRYEYPGRYKRWDIGFVNPPLEISSRDDAFELRALNERGAVLLPLLAKRLQGHDHFREVTSERSGIRGFVRPSEKFFTEEERSKRPSVLSVVREVQKCFFSPLDAHLGLYGAFAYDLVFQFEPVERTQARQADQRDLVLYLPDELFVTDHYRQKAFCYRYDFETAGRSTRGLPRAGEALNFRGVRRRPEKDSDHAPGEYQQQVVRAAEYFRRGDLFEVVPSQSFYERCDARPSELFHRLMRINPSPYGFVFNLGGEYLIGSSPEMFVRVEGRRVETCPISGTIRRGGDAIEDAERIKELLNSRKDESELTMCTDVDRNDKSRICEPGSVRVIGRRQVEMYSHLIHTVDHVEGLLRPGFDALDAFLTHTWAVTVTGAPKRAAMQFIERHEHSPRRWYGGAVGYLTFDGNMNTGLVLRTIRLKDSVAEIRVGATLLYDSVPEAEERETHVKAAALVQTLRGAGGDVGQSRESMLKEPLAGDGPGEGKRVLLIDYEDSFVHTLANYIRQTGANVVTLRHGFDESLFDEERPDMVVLSPGPGRPGDFRVPETVAACVRRRIPVVGVCLGLQGIVESYGGELGVLDYPMHGKPSRVRVTDPAAHLFRDLPETFGVGRYHSLYALPDRLPRELKVTAVSEDGIIMGIEHESLPVAAIQFHPESIMTLAGDVGSVIIRNAIRSYTGGRTATPHLNRQRVPPPGRVGVGAEHGA